MDSNILSAENYYDRAFEGSPMVTHNSKSQWLGGLLANRTVNRSSIKQSNSRTNTHKSVNKESPKSPGTDESIRVRQRGRPRLDTRDQTAADRRRTQIRLAQRAYRQRKETTIAGLNERVTALEQTIEEMNKAFLDFNDKAIASGIGDWGPSLAGDLKLTVERFLEYAQNMAQESEVEDEPMPNISARVFEHEDDNPKVDDQTPSSSVKSAKSSEQTQSDGCPPVAATLGYGYQLDADIDVCNVQISEMDKTQAMQISNPDVSGWLEPVQQYRVELLESIEQKTVPLPSFTTSLALPASYSFQEKSFARRLLRTSLESAYRLVTNPNAREEDIFRVCMNTFTWSNKELFTAKLKDFLSKPAEESLENWAAPQWHLGNAGIHYPRTGFDFGSSPPPGWDDKALTGPLPLVQVDNPMDDTLSTDDIVKLLGFDGEWFDPNDVEQYLRSKGIFLDGHSTFVEVNVNLFTESPHEATTFTESPLEASLSTFGSPTNSSQDSMEGPHSPQNIEGYFSDGPNLQTDDYSWSEEMLNIPEYRNTDMDTKSLSNLNVIGEEIFPKMSLGLDAPSKRYIDVEKFIRTIVGSAVCLGRAPGFRKSSVDSALVLAIQ